MPMRFEPPSRGVAVQLECGVWTYTSVSFLLAALTNDGVDKPLRYHPMFSRCRLHPYGERIVHVRDHEWIAECDTCHWYRWAGGERRLATRMRGRHVSDNMDHRTRIHYTNLPGLEYYRLVAPEHLWKETS